MAVTTMGRPRSMRRTWPSAPLRTHTQAWVGSVPATAWAALDPGGHPGAEAVKGIGVSAPASVGGGDTGAAATLIWVVAPACSGSGWGLLRMASRVAVTPM